MSNFKRKQVKAPEDHNRELLDLQLETSADTMNNLEQGFILGLCRSSHEHTATTPAAEFGNDWEEAFCSSKRELRIEQKVKRGRKKRKGMAQLCMRRCLTSSMYCNSKSLHAFCCCDACNGCKQQCNKFSLLSLHEKQVRQQNLLSGCAQQNQT